MVEDGMSHPSQIGPMSPARPSQTKKAGGAGGGGGGGVGCFSSNKEGHGVSALGFVVWVSGHG